MWIILGAVYLLVPGCGAQLRQSTREWDAPPHYKTAQASNQWARTQSPKPSGKSKAQIAPPPVNKPWGGTPTTITEIPIDAQDHIDYVQLEALRRMAPIDPQTPVLAVAERFLGVPYVWGGESLAEGGFDCSGLVQYVFSLKGIAMVRLANEQFLQGQEVARDALLPGDLVFFSTGGKIVDHVGIYAGDGRFLHAPRTGRVVSYDQLDSAYFGPRFRGGRRLI